MCGLKESLKNKDIFRSCQQIVFLLFTKETFRNNGMKQLTLNSHLTFKISPRFYC